METLKKGHCVRVRPDRWMEIEEKALELTAEGKKFVKPTDLIDFLLSTKVESVNLKDMESLKKKRA